MQVSKDRIDEMAKVLVKIVDVHHRTIIGSRLHTTDMNLNFWECSCYTCKSATEILIKNGYDPKDFIEYPGNENKVT